MTYTWEAATNRLVGFARDNGTSVFTTTLGYDSLNRIAARFTATYSTTYTYLGDSDWLLKETKYPFGGAAFDLVQYRYISPKLMCIVLRDGGACNIVLYLQMNWHGDFYRGYATDGGIVNTQQGDEWGVWLSAPLACGAPHSYHWNAQWGYQFFVDLSAPNGTDPQLGLYYVHGRWYNPEVGLFLSPDEKGEYFYGSGQDAVNYAWVGEGGRLKLSLTEIYSRYLGRRFGDYDWFALDWDFVLAHAGEWSGEIGVVASGQPYYPGSSELYLWELGRKYLAEGKPTLKQVLLEAWDTWPQLLPEAGVIGYGLITEAKGENVNIPVVRASSDVLSRNMEARGRPRLPNSAAHHIVAGNAPRAAQSRAILQREGIGINDADNGVFLPSDRTVSNPTGATVHSTLNTNVYNDAVFARLNQAAPGTVRDTLRQIASELLAGTFPH